MVQVKDPPTEVHAINSGATGSMAVPYEVRVDPELGRCLHAAAPINKGDLVWRFSNVRTWEYIVWYMPLYTDFLHMCSDK